MRVRIIRIKTVWRSRRWDFCAFLLEILIALCHIFFCDNFSVLFFFGASQLAYVQSFFSARLKAKALYVKCTKKDVWVNRTKMQEWTVECSLLTCLGKAHFFGDYLIEILVNCKRRYVSCRRCHRTNRRSWHEHTWSYFFFYVFRLNSLELGSYSPKHTAVISRSVLAVWLLLLVGPRILFVAIVVLFGGERNAASCASFFSVRARYQSSIKKKNEASD